MYYNMYDVFLDRISLAESENWSFSLNSIAEDELCRLKVDDGRHPLDAQVVMSLKDTNWRQLPYE